MEHIQAQDNRHIKTTENDPPKLIEQICFIISMLLVVLTFPLSMIFCLTVLPEYERAVILRLGRLKKGGARGPGLVFILPCIDTLYRVDLRTSSYHVAPQEILTKDSVTIYVDAVIYYRMKEPLKAVIQIAAAEESTKLLSQTTLRKVTGTKMLMEMLSEKESLSIDIEHILDEITDRWGVKVERVEIKDVRLPLELQRAMAAEAEATREAKAKIVAAEGELNAARFLKEASDVMSQNPISLQLRYLQTLASISQERNSTTVFPFPIDFLQVPK
ncbi:stomatin-like [Teleopsis dalmanni]|uniref:stomatin-like n=1 Tax=Teleopsis dalmanni TaxID=139649 RepID=UPI0018CEB9F0|nr:stomatin-like [Teleopsis dalmanni]